MDFFGRAHASSRLAMTSLRRPAHTGSLTEMCVTVLLIDITSEHRAVRNHQTRSRRREHPAQEGASMVLERSSFVAPLRMGLHCGPRPFVREWSP